MRSMIVAPWGDEKTSKTTFALSFPKPLYHFDIDVGGFDRAAWRMTDDDPDANADGVRELTFPDGGVVTTKKYSQPIPVERMMGQMVSKTAKQLTIRFPKKVVGMRELWQDIITDYVRVLGDPRVKSISFDSFTQMWNICHKAHLQELQEKQEANTPGIPENDLRESLKSVEYGPANDRMRSVIYNARSMNKNLIITHYPKDIYGVRVNVKGVTEDYRTGAETLDGFKEVAKLIDLAVRTQTKVINTPEGKESIVTSTITTCGLPGLGFKAEGMPLPTNDYQGILSLVKMLGGAK